MVTLGERGAVLAGPEGIVGGLASDSAAPPYAVGSGDAFLAGVLMRRASASGAGRSACGSRSPRAIANAEEPGRARLDRGAPDLAAQVEISAVEVTIVPVRVRD